MLIIVGLIFISVLIAGGFLWAFIWATRSGQFEDTYGPGVRILFDDRKMEEKPKEEGV